MGHINEGEEQHKEEVAGEEEECSVGHIMHLSSDICDEEDCAPAKTFIGRAPQQVINFFLWHDLQVEFTSWVRLI